MKNKIEAPAREVSPLKSFRFALSDIPNILGLVYLFAIGIGMLFTYQKFSRFGINIFDYADVFDFLIAPFADFTMVSDKYIKPIDHSETYKVKFFIVPEFIFAAHRLKNIP